LLNCIISAVVSFSKDMGIKLFTNDTQDLCNFAKD